MSGTAEDGRVGRSAVVTSIAQAISMAAGGVLAVLVAVLIGNDARTDGFFAAYGLYAVAVLFAQSARTTIVARIVEPGAFDRYVGAIVVVLLVFGVVFVALGAPVASLLTGDLPQAAEDTARTALLVLWPAVGGQLFGSLAAAMLGTLGDFTSPALAFCGGGILSIVAFVALEPALGIDAVAAGILAGSTFTGTLLAVALLRTGWRPELRRIADLRAGARGAGVMTVSSLAFLIAQIGFLVTLAVAARFGEGIVTVFSYSYAAVGILIALLASVPAIVLAAPLATSWDRRPATLLPHHRAVWMAGLLLLAPIAGSAWLIGDEVAGVVLAGFTEAEADLTLRLFLILVPSIALASAIAVPQTALYTLGRYRLVAGLSAGIVGVQVALTLLAGAIDEVDLLAAVFTVGGLLSVIGYVGAISPAYLRASAPMLALGGLRVAGVAVAAFGLPALVLPDVAALGAGCVLYAVGVVAVLPDERALGQRMLALLQRRRATTPAQ